MSKGSIKIGINVCGNFYNMDAYVVKNLSYDLILGKTFLSRFVITFKVENIYLENNQLKPEYRRLDNPKVFINEDINTIVSSVVKNDYVTM